ncbi:hypothetical protein EZS27_027374 [termite gut metagenome]|uniref:Uncharacterized protein n=1 Tax=termite gut metagenome TaxID=433724 RepID=A0A5J4QMN4_9ZZZZ
MENILDIPQIISIENQIINTINRINERGIDDNNEIIDDYSNLIEIKEYKNALITEIYEAYFPPKRHEFEFELISNIVDAIISSKCTFFIAGAAASGLIGDIFTNIVKQLLKKIIDLFKHSPSESQKFTYLLKDIEKIELYFKNNNGSIEINKIERELQIEKERLIPILKLLGFRTYREKGKRYWEKH